MYGGCKNNKNEEKTNEKERKYNEKIQWKRKKSKKIIFENQLVKNKSGEKSKKYLVSPKNGSIFATSKHGKELFEKTVESRCNSVGRVADL